MDFNVHKLPDSIAVKVLTNGKMPTRATDGAAGYDCYACLSNETMTVEEARNLETAVSSGGPEIGSASLIGLGFCIEIPEGYVGLLIPRSSLWKTSKLSLSNCVGVIDSDYRGEVMASLTTYMTGLNWIKHGDRLVQLLIMPVATPDLVSVKDLMYTQRGDGGFGSTGK